MTTRPIHLIAFESISMRSVDTTCGSVVDGAYASDNPEAVTCKRCVRKISAALDVSEATALALIAEGVDADEAIERAADAAMASLRVQA